MKPPVNVRMDMMAVIAAMRWAVPRTATAFMVTEYAAEGCASVMETGLATTAILLSVKMTATAMASAIMARVFAKRVLVVPFRLSVQSTLAHVTARVKAHVKTAYANASVAVRCRTALGYHVPTIALPKADAMMVFVSAIQVGRAVIATLLPVQGKMVVAVGMAGATSLASVTALAGRTARLVLVSVAPAIAVVIVVCVTQPLVRASVGGMPKVQTAV